MSKDIAIDVLTLCRTQPVQGKPVAVQMQWNGQSCGELHLPFTAWIKLNRLLSYGIEADRKEQGKLQVKVQVKGASAAELQSRTISLSASEEDDDEDIRMAEQQARLDTTAAAAKDAQVEITAATAPAQVAQLVRSLRTEGDSDGNK